MPMINQMIVAVTIGIAMTLLPIAGQAQTAQQQTSLPFPLPTEIQEQQGLGPDAAAPPAEQRLEQLIWDAAGRCFRAKTAPPRSCAMRWDVGKRQFNGQNLTTSGGEDMQNQPQPRMPDGTPALQPGTTPQDLNQQLQQLDQIRQIYNFPALQQLLGGENAAGNSSNSAQ